VLVLAAMAGCNSILGIGDVHPGGGADAPAAPDAMVDASPPTDVNGTAIDTYVGTSATNTMLAEDLTGYTIAAYLPDGQGGFQIINGNGTKDGHFTIPQVPAGGYYLLFTPPANGFNNTAFFYTTTHTPDMGYQWIGRAGAPQATMPTLVDVMISNMTPTLANPNADYIEVVSFSDGDSSSPIPFGLPAGSTTVDTGGLDWSQFSVSPPNEPLLQSGEDLTALHFVRQSDSNNAFPEITTHLVDYYTNTSLTLTDGQPTTVHAALTPVTENKTQSMTTNTAQFLQGLDVAPDQPVTMSLRRRAAPGAESALSIRGVLQADMTFPYGLQFVGASWQYGDPFPASWIHYIFDYVGLTYSYRTRGTNLPDPYYSSSTFERRLAADSITIAPAFAAPHNIKVGGVLARTPVAVPYDGIHAVTVSWAPINTINHYVVTVLQLDAPSNVPALDQVVTFDTTQTQIEMPAALFTTGSSYVISVAAETQGNVDYPGGKLRELGFPRTSREGVTARLLFAASCGNGTVDAAYEDCDSSGINTATCNADCSKAMCGDAVANSAAGEQCDTGGDSLICDSDCTNVMCGDGHVNAVAGEACDKGAMNGMVGGCCTGACQLANGATSCP
jgi:hypothetical protein